MYEVILLRVVLRGKLSKTVLYFEQLVNRLLYGSKKKRDTELDTS